MFNNGPSKLKYFLRKEALFCGLFIQPLLLFHESVHSSPFPKVVQVGFQSLATKRVCLLHNINVPEVWFVTEKPCTESRDEDESVSFGVHGQFGRRLPYVKVRYKSLYLASASREVKRANKLQRME